MPASAERTGTAARPVPATAPSRIALLGNPNTGKTTLFNRLCGARAKTSNFPGTTTNVRVRPHGVRRRRRLPRSSTCPASTNCTSTCAESRLCRDVLAGAGPYRAPDAVVVVVDACNLTRNLVLAGEILSSGLADRRRA